MHLYAKRLHQPRLHHPRLNQRLLKRLFKGLLKRLRLLAGPLLRRQLPTSSSPRLRLVRVLSMLSVLSVQQLSKPKALTAVLAPRVCGTVLLPVALHPAEEGLKQQLHLLRWLRLHRRLSLTTTYCPNAATWSSTRSTTMAMIKEKMVRRTGGWRRSVGDPCGHSAGRGGDWGMHGSIAVQLGMRYMSAKGRRDHRSNSRSNSGTVFSGPCSGG